MEELALLQGDSKACLVSFENEYLDILGYDVARVIPIFIVFVCTYCRD